MTYSIALVETQLGITKLTCVEERTDLREAMTRLFEISEMNPGQTFKLLIVLA